MNRRDLFKALAALAVAAKIGPISGGGSAASSAEDVEGSLLIAFATGGIALSAVQGWTKIQESAEGSMWYRTRPDRAKHTGPITVRHHSVQSFNDSSGLCVIGVDGANLDTPFAEPDPYSCVVTASSGTPVDD